jgi:protein-S-isoprenylcysteine O-methyltransferase Ste14
LPREVPKLGARGEGWVVLQSVLFVLMPVAGVVGPNWPASAETALRVAGGALAVAGLALVALGFGYLGRSLTPFPRPAEEGSLVETGPYRYVRHPVYTGGLVFLSGVALAYSPLVFVPTAALAVVWGLKTRVEERFLRDRYPEYASYCERTRFRLVPFVY